MSVGHRRAVAGAAVRAWWALGAGQSLDAVPVELLGLRPLIAAGHSQEVGTNIDRGGATRSASSASGPTPNAAVPRQIITTFTPVEPSSA